MISWFKSSPRPRVSVCCVMLCVRSFASGRPWCCMQFPRRWRSWRSKTDTLERKDLLSQFFCLNSHGKHPVQTLKSRVCAPTPILLMLFAQSKHSLTWSTGGTNYFKDFSSLLSLKVEGHSFIGVSDENLRLLHRTLAGCRGFLDFLNCQERNFQSMYILYIYYFLVT